MDYPARWKCFAANLARLKGNASDRAFARQCGVTPTNVRAYLDGKKQPGFDVLVRIASSCGEVSLDWLLFGVDHAGERTVDPVYRGQERVHRELEQDVAARVHRELPPAVRSLVRPEEIDGAAILADAAREIEVPVRADAEALARQVAERASYASKKSDARALAHALRNDWRVRTAALPMGATAAHGDEVAQLERLDAGIKTIATYLRLHSASRREPRAFRFLRSGAEGPTLGEILDALPAFAADSLVEGWVRWYARALSPVARASRVRRVDPNLAEGPAYD